MAIYVSKNGDIHFYKGDSGNITFKGIPTDKNYSVYFAVSYPDTNSVIGDELSVSSNYSSSVTFSISASFTDKMPINSEDSTAIYQYGLKLCSGDDEYTVIPKVSIQNNEPVFGASPRVIVHKKFVEGTSND